MKQIEQQLELQCLSLM